MTRERLQSLPLEELRRFAERQSIEFDSALDKDALVSLLVDLFEEMAEEREEGTERVVSVEAKKYSAGRDEEIDTGETALVPLPETYNETRLVAIPRDPAWAFAYWEIRQDRLAALRRDKDVRLLLRVHDVEGVRFNGRNSLSSFDIPVKLTDSRWYISLPHAGGRFILELLYKKEGKRARAGALRRHREPGRRVLDKRGPGLAFRGRRGRSVDVAAPVCRRDPQLRQHPAANPVGRIEVPMPKAFLALVLHAHLPFVRHPEHKRFLEENWLFEAISETYLPLIRVFERLREKGIRFRMCLSVSPTLAAMLRDPVLQERYLQHLRLTIELAHKELDRTRSMPELHKLALMYLSLYERDLEDYNEKHGRDLLAVFRRLRDEGSLDLITTSATHAFLPVLREYPKGVEAQIKVAVDFHADVFGKRPRGFWLPECGYYPGLEELLERHGLAYFFVDSHAVAYADTRPKYGVFAPLVCPNGVAAFGRDPEAARAVWSQEEGYPGDVSYREFYRDIGFDLPLDYYPALHPRRRHPHQHGPQVPRHHRAGRAEGALRPAGGAAHGPGARRQLSLPPAQAGRAPRAPHRQAAPDRRPLRRGALRPLVVRRARLDRGPGPQDSVRGRLAGDDHPRGLPQALRQESAGDARRSRAGATRGTPRSGSTAATTGSTRTSTRRWSAWASWRTGSPPATGCDAGS